MHGIVVHAFFSEASSIWELKRPPPKTDFERKKKLLHHRMKYPICGLGTQREFYKTKLQKLDDFGLRKTPPFFSENKIAKKRYTSTVARVL